MLGRAWSPRCSRSARSPPSSSSTGALRPSPTPSSASRPSTSPPPLPIERLPRPSPSTASTLSRTCLLISPNDPAYAHEVEAVGTMRVLAGAGQGSPSAPGRRVEHHRLRRLALQSQSPDERRLQGARGSRFLTDKVEIERQVLDFMRGAPRSHGERAPLRPHRRRHALRSRGRVPRQPLCASRPRLLDPCAGGTTWTMPAALGACLIHAHPGEFNIASNGVLPLSAALRRAEVHAAAAATLGLGRGAPIDQRAGLSDLKRSPASKMTSPLPLRRRHSQGPGGGNRWYPYHSGPR